MRLIVGAIVIMVFGIMLLILLRNNIFAKDANFSCDSFKFKYDNADCGYLTSSTDSKVHTVIAKVVEKYIADGKYYIKILTKTSSGKNHFETITLPSSGIKFSINTISKNSSNINGNLSSTQYYSNQEGLRNVKNNEEIIVDVLTPPKSSMPKLEARFPNTDYIRCFDYHKSFINYLKKPTLLNYLVLQEKKLIKKCNITTLQITKLQ